MNDGMTHYESDVPMEAFENAFSEKKIRMAFIRKVYGILLVQLAITVGVISLFMFQPDVKKYSIEHQYIMWVALGLTIAIMFVLVCFTKVRRTFPANFICLFLFTFFESIFLGTITCRFNVESVLIAAGICTVVCLALTIFAFQTKIDFTMCSGMLFAALIILIVFGFLAIFIRGKIVHIIYAALGALVFSLYLVFDTQMMIGGKHKYSISPEEYIFAALNIYLDIITLFLMILQLVGEANND